MDEKRKAAHHEAGHCFRAWCIYSPAVISVCLTDDGGEWEGNTSIKRSWFPVEGFIHVALVGTIAEAKAVASENNPPRQVATSAALATAICEKCDHLDQEDVWEVSVPIVGQNAQTANITKADLEQIPAADRSQAAITAALEKACAFVNNDVHWRVITNVATELEKMAPKCFNQFRIFYIVRETTEADLLDPD